MPPAAKWTLADLIDFEAALAAWDGRADAQRSRGAGRPAVLREWLAQQAIGGPGTSWVGALRISGALLALLMACLGAGAAWGTLNRELEGIHVIWFLAVTLVIPWIFLLAGLLGWALRGKFRRSGLGGWLIERCARRILSGRAEGVVEMVRQSGELARVVGWRLARLTQWTAVAFHGGALLGLAAMVMFKRVGFFWETTTQAATQSLLESMVRVLSSPWVALLPGAVPDVAASRRGPGWDGGGESWWPFLLLALLVWGVLPRLALGMVALGRERSLLGNLAFQAPGHRRLWRKLTEVRRGEEPQGPVDGALLIVVGGAEPDPDALRPFLLNRLRVNPTAWESLGVLDAGREEAARAALDKAPAGIVLLAEGWALSPRQMDRALAEVAARAGERRIVVLVGDAASDGRLRPPGEAERAEWERYADTRRDAEFELVFFEEREEP